MTSARRRPVIIVACGVIVWYGVIHTTGAPPYILPAPHAVLSALFAKSALIGHHALTTAFEIIAGSVLGIAIGLSTAVTMACFRPVQQWLLPVLVASQAIPVFALAPLLTLWFGYGLASKIAMATLIIFFPVTATFYDGLRRTEPGWIDLARTMGGSPWTILRHIRIPAALPAAASGIRVALAVAPIGAVVGEWVGSSSGLGYLMLHANARLQVDVMFAALLVLTGMGLALYFTFDRFARRILVWNPDTHPDSPRKDT